MSKEVGICGDSSVSELEGIAFIAEDANSVARVVASVVVIRRVFKRLVVPDAGIDKSSNLASCSAGKNRHGSKPMLCGQVPVT